MFRLPAHPSHIPTQPEGPELIEVGRPAWDTRNAPPDASVEASAYRPASKVGVKPKLKPAVPPKPGVRRLIYIEVEPNASARQRAAPRTPPEEKIIYSSIDPQKTAAFQKAAGLEASEPVTPAFVPDPAKRVLIRGVGTLIQDLVRSRPAGPFKVFKSKDSYGARRAMREFAQSIDKGDFKKEMRAYVPQFPRTAHDGRGARRAATEELTAMAAMMTLHGLSSEQRETLKRHVERTGGLVALTTMLGKARDGWMGSACKGLQIALENFLTEEVGMMRE